MDQFNCQYSYPGRLTKSATASVLAHVLLCALVFLLAELKLIKFNNTNTTVVLAERSVRVDIVAMPKMTFKELEELEQARVQAETIKAPEEQKAATKDEKGPELLKAQQKKDFMSMLKNIGDKNIKNKAKPNKNEKTNEGEISEQMKAKLSNLVMAGNKLSKGDALTGSLSDTAGTVFSGYISKLPAAIKPHWKLPSYLIGQSLKCRIQVFIAEDGKILKTIIHESSGVAEYDQKALDAIRKANPFPQVPPEVKAKAVAGAIILGFPL